MTSDTDSGQESNVGQKRTTFESRPIKALGIVATGIALLLSLMACTPSKSFPALPTKNYKKVCSDWGPLNKPSLQICGDVTGRTITATCQIQGKEASQATITTRIKPSASGLGEKEMQEKIIESPGVRAVASNLSPGDYTAECLYKLITVSTPRMKVD